MEKIKASITAIGGYVPEKVLSNAQLEKELNTSDAWISERTGIKERRILDDDELATSFMATEAVKDLLANYPVDAKAVDCVLLATATPDYGLSPASSLVCSKAGLSNAWGVDMNGACSGFLYALTTGSSFIESGRYKSVLVIGADKMSSIVDYKDRSTCILFGDGAGAVLLEPGDENSGIQQSIFKTDGNGTPSLLVPGGGSLQHADQNFEEDKKRYIQQNGKVVFRQAIKNMSDNCKEVLELAGLNSQDIDWVVPHQANYRIIQGVSEQTEIPLEKFKINIQKYGNTTSATIPLCLWDFKNDFKKGDNIIITAFGAGYSWGSTLIKW